MKRFVLTASVAAAAALAFLSPARAGGVYVDDGYGSHVGAGGHHGWRHARATHAWRSDRHRAWDASVSAGTLNVTATYGAEPAYYPGTGGGASNGAFFAARSARVQVVEYHEPYIARGLLYNVPPERLGSSAAVVSARY